MQPSPYAPPTPQPVKLSTPFKHCAMGALVWYVAACVVFSLIALKFSLQWGNVLPALILGAVLWVLTSTATWLMLRRSQVQRWVQILITLPVYVAVWFLLTGAVGVFANVYVNLVR